MVVHVEWSLWKQMVQISFEVLLLDEEVVSLLPVIDWSTICSICQVLVEGI